MRCTRMELARRKGGAAARDHPYIARLGDQERALALLYCSANLGSETIMSYMMSRQAN